MSNSDDIVLLLERDGSERMNDTFIIGVNEAFRRASGYSDDQLFGHEAADLFPTENHAETLMNAIHGTGSLRSELACRQANGGTFMLGMHLMPASERTPGRGCFVVLGRDITAVLQARRMQDSIQRLLAKVFSSVDVAVAIVSSAGRIVMTNPHVDLLLGYKPNGLIGRTSIELVVPSSRPLVTAILQQQVGDGRDTTYSAPVLRADGSQLVLRITSVVAAAGDSKQFCIVTLRPEAIGAPVLRSESVGKIKLVGLDEVRSALGARWPTVAERVMATAEAVVKRNCGAQDSYSRADDTSFLVCFGALSEEEAAFRAAMIGREIRNRLIGQGEDPDNAYVRSIAAVVRFPDHGESDASVQGILLDGLDKQLERLEHEARQTLRSALAGGKCDLERVSGREAATIVATQLLIPDKLERQLVSAVFALPPNESKAFDLDGLLMGFAAQYAIASMARGDTMPLLVKISFDIFATRATTERFFAVCAKLDSRVTSRLVVLLSSLPEGLPRTRLQDCVNRLRPFCRAVGYQVEEVATLPPLDMSNSFNPIIVLPATLRGVNTPSKLKELFSSLQSRRAKVLVRGVVSEEDAAAFRSMGADMISMKRPES
jgi:PAS domain S-box-containing protein